MSTTYRQLDVSTVDTTVLGGGPAALVEVRALLDAAACVTVVAHELCDGLHDLVERRLVRHERESVNAPAFVVLTDESWRAVAEGWFVPMVDAVPTTTTATGRGSVVLVGGGPGDPGLLTRRGYEALAQADVVVADRLAPLGALDGLTCEVIDVAKIPRGRFTPQERINEILVELALAGRRVVRLKGGDSYVFGRGMEEVIACREAGIEVEVVPGVTSAVSVPELAGIPVTHRGMVQGFTVVSGHAGPDDPRSTVDWGALARGGTTLVVLMGVETLPAIARAVLADRPAETPLACVMDGGLPSQRVVRTTLGVVAEHGTPEGVAAPAVTVIGQVASFAG